MRRRLLASVGGKALPYDAEVEWLSSDRHQYIITDYIPSSRTHWRIDYKFNVIEQVFSCVAGIAGASNNDRSMQFGHNSDANYNTYYYNSSVNNYPNSGIDTSRTVIYRDGSTAKMTKIGGTYNGSRQLNSTFTCPSEIVLFGRMLNGEVGGLSDATIYSVQFGEGGELVRDFIPVRFTNENGVSEGVLYDRVSGKLFRNAGTGAFAIGPDKTT